MAGDITTQSKQGMQVVPMSSGVLQKLMGDNLKVVWAKFSTLTKAALLCVQWHGLYKHGRV